MIIGIITGLLLINERIPTPEPSSQIQVQIWQNEPTGKRTPTITSKYVTSPPTVDGILDRSEWSEPLFMTDLTMVSQNRETLGNKVSGNMEGYFVNDDNYLHAALVISFSDSSEMSIRNDKVQFDLAIYFDDDNDGVIRIGEDAKRLDRRTGQGYMDCHLSDNGWQDYLEQQDGIAADHYDSNSYTCEFEIPLNSGDPFDLAVQPGDTIGVKWVIYPFQELELDRYYGGGELSWPTTADVEDATHYGKLVLAQKPAL